ncbi:MAG TPA: hypothetical protein PLR76_01815 [Hyphomonas sp.]|nr:hypothetical protein [Hyphomonas sp.]MCB9971401.1 hypothetical protein [Hyphomonas sp.]HPE47095.1 hypothetical protein [Hyphomonas sp.]
MKTIRNMLAKLLLAGAVALLASCASYDAQDRYILGNAVAANIAEQSVRDVTVPNSAEIDSASGVRAANAVRALNEGKSKPLPDTPLGGGGEGL